MQILEEDPEDNVFYRKKQLILDDLGHEGTDVVLHLLAFGIDDIFEDFNGSEALLAANFKVGQRIALRIKPKCREWVSLRQLTAEERQDHRGFCGTLNEARVQGMTKDFFDTRFHLLARTCGFAGMSPWRHEGLLETYLDVHLHSRPLALHFLEIGRIPAEWKGRDRRNEDVYHRTH